MKYPIMTPVYLDGQLIHKLRNNMTLEEVNMAIKFLYRAELVSSTQDRIDYRTIDEQPTHKYLYEVKDSSGTIRKIGLDRKSAKYALEEYNRVYHYQVESITYIGRIELL